MERFCSILMKFAYEKNAIFFIICFMIHLMKYSGSLRKNIPFKKKDCCSIIFRSWDIRILRFSWILMSLMNINEIRLNFEGEYLWWKLRYFHKLFFQWYQNCPKNWLVMAIWRSLWYIFKLIFGPLIKYAN